MSQFVQVEEQVSYGNIVVASGDHVGGVVVHGPYVRTGLTHVLVDATDLEAC